MKKFVAFALVLLLLVPMAVSVSAEDGFSPVVDGAEIFSPQQEAELTQRINEVYAEKGHEIFIVTYKHPNGVAMKSLAENSLKQLQRQKGSNGTPAIILALAVTTRDWYVYADESDEKIPSSDIMSDYFLNYLSNNDYYGGCMAFVEGVNTELSFPLARNIVICLIIGLVIAFIIVSSMKAKLKSVNYVNNAREYVRKDSFVLERSRDLYLYSTITRVAKPKNTSNGGMGSRGGGSRSGGGKF